MSTAPIFLPAAATGAGVGAGAGAAGVTGATGDGPAAPMIRVKSLWTGWAAITGADGGRLMFAPGIGVAEADGDGGSGTTGGGPDQGLDGDSGGGGGADGRGGGATMRSMADVALGAGPLLPPEGIGGGGGMNCGAGGEGSGSERVAPKILVNSPGAAGGGAGAFGGGGGGAAGGFGPLPGSRNLTEIAGPCGLGSDLGSGGGGGVFGTEAGVHDSVLESISATGAPRGVPDGTKISVNPPDGGGETRSSHFPNESKSRIMRVTTTGAPSTFSTPSTRSRASGGRRSRRASIAARSDALS
jgi:hypothetical protein